MNIELETLIWLFPIAFMFHDFEELLFGEAWLRKNGAEIERRLPKRVPALIRKQIGAVLNKTTLELAFPIALIFALTCLASFTALAFGRYGFFLIASGAFFLHGFMHVGQALLLRRYVPAAITSAVIVIPYGWLLYSKLLAAGVISAAGMLTYFGLAMLLTIPFILGMHRVGDWVYRRAVRILVR